jgi:hypothetical protein
MIGTIIHQLVKHLQSELALLGINYETLVEEDFQKLDNILDQSEIEGLYEKYKEFVEIIQEINTVLKKL